jgi:DeoR family glycerol-3-phosphate regulon repressor
MTGANTRFAARGQPPADSPQVTRRQSLILDAVRSQGAVSVASLATQFDVTHQTIRRDLRSLQDRGLLQKGFGAAFASPGVARHGYDERHGTLAGVKRRLVRALEEFLTPDATIFVGLGTTFESLHEVVERHPDILIATPNLTVAHTCALQTDATVYVYGGYVRNKDSSVLTMSDQSRTRFKFDVAIIGASAIDEEGSILEFDPMEVDLVRDVLKQSRKVILVAHVEKFDRHAPHIVTTLNDIDVLITNGKPAAVRALGTVRPALRIVSVE